MDAVLAHCDTSRKDEVEQLMGRSVTIQMLTANKATVMDKADGWYAVRPRIGEEQISDAKIIILKELIDAERDKTYWEGEVVFNGKKTPFRSDSALISKNTETWLTRVLRKAGLGTPTIQHNWRNQLVLLAKRFSKYTSVEATRRIGPDEAGQIIFPNFSIVGGKFGVTRSFVSDSCLPAANVYEPIRKDSDIRLNQRNKHAEMRPLFVAYASTFVANMLADYYEEKRMPVAAVGGYLSVSRSMAREFADSSGMITHELSRAHPRAVAAIRDNLNLHNYPEFVDTPSTGLLCNYPVINRDHVMIGMTEAEAAAMAVGGNWVMVRVASGADKIVKIPPFGEVLEYLANLQLREFELCDGGSSPCLILSILADISEWYEIHLRIDPEELRSAARKHLYFPGFAGDELLRLFATLCKVGYAAVDHEPFMTYRRVKSRAALVIDDQDHHVYMSRKGLLAALKKAKIALPDVKSATADLAARRMLHEYSGELNGWVVNSKTWEHTTHIGLS
jgi:hypothetical protein